MRHPIWKDPPDPLLFWLLSNGNPPSLSNAHEGWLEFESGSCPGNPKGPRATTGILVCIQIRSDHATPEVAANVETL